MGGREPLHGAHASEHQALELRPVLCSACASARLRRRSGEVVQERSRKAARTCKTGAWVEPSLLLALGRTYGLQYAALGVLRLADIALGFAGGQPAHAPPL